MDPYIENQRWSGFHHMLIAELASTLVKMLRPRYEVDPEERIYVETAFGEPRVIRPDVAVSTSAPSRAGNSTAAAVLDVEPNVYTLPMPMLVEERESYLVIRKTGEQKVVTVIEVLSPANKRPGSDGRREYLKKRHEILRSDSHLVEIDLLLGGERLPTIRPLLRTTDYCAFVCRAGQRPEAEVFEWSIRSRLPRLPIPLVVDDPDAIVDLQPAMNAVYDRSGYDYALDYSVPLSVPLRPADEDWVKQLFAARTSS
jgi:hypothetical protein